MSSVTIDFLHPQRHPRLGWVLLALGAAALALSLWADQQWAREQETRESVRRQREDAAQAARAQAAKPVLPTPQELRTRSVAPQLRQPWLPLLRVIEGVTEPPVFLLGLSVDPASGSVRVDGEAPSFADALAYADALRNEDVLVRSQLRSHDVSTDPASGRQAVRFSIVSQWIAK